MITVNVLPCWRTERTLTAPPWSSASSLTTASPSPVPLYLWFYDWRLVWR